MRKGRPRLVRNEPGPAPLHGYGVPQVSETDSGLVAILGHPSHR